MKFSTLFFLLLIVLSGSHTYAQNIPLQGVSIIEWSGEKLAVGYFDGSFKIFNRWSMSVLFEQPPKEDTIISAFSWDSPGTKLAVGFEGYGIEIWDLTNLQLIQFIPTHFGDLLWSADGNFLLVGTGDIDIPILRKYNPYTQELMQENRIFTNQFILLDESTIISYGISNVLFIDSNELSIIKTIDLTEETNSSRISSITISPDKQYIVIGYDTNKILVWDIATEQVIATLDGGREIVDDSFISELAFNESGSRLSSVARNGTIHVWDTTTWELIAETNLNTDLTGTASFSPDGAILAYSKLGENPEIQFLDLDFLVVSQRISEIKWSHDGTKLAVGYYNGSFRILNIADMSVLFEQEDNFGYIQSFAWNYTNTQLAVGRGRTIEIWDVVTFQKLLSRDTGDIVAYSLTWLNDNHLIVSGDGEVGGYIFDTITGEFINSIGVFSEVHIINNGSIGVGNRNTSTIFINLSDMVINDEIRFENSGPSYTRISPNEDIMAVGFVNVSIDIIDLQSLETIIVLKGWNVISEERNFILKITFNEAGTQLHTLSLAGTLRIWDTITWDMLASFELGYLGYSADFSPDGMILAYANHSSPYVRFIDINDLIITE